MAQPKPKYVTRHLPCDLTPEERDARVDSLVELHKRKEATIKKRSEITSKLNGEVKEIDSEIATLTDTISTRRENREVRCRVEKDFEAGTIDTIREDTGDCIDSRRLREEERQTAIPGALTSIPGGKTEKAPSSPKTGGKANAKERKANTPEPEPLEAEKA